MSNANRSEREAFAKLLADYGCSPRHNDYDLERNAYRFADLMRLYEAASPVSTGADEQGEIKYIMVDHCEVNPQCIVEALQDGDLAPDEAVKWIEKLIRHNMSDEAGKV